MKLKVSRQRIILRVIAKCHSSFRGHAEGISSRTIPERRESGRIPNAVSFSHIRLYYRYLTSGRRKGQANVQAVEERQQVEALKREERTLSRALATQKGKLDQLLHKKDKLTGDSVTQTELLKEVSFVFLGTFSSTDNGVYPV